MNDTIIICVITYDFDDGIINNFIAQSNYNSYIDENHIDNIFIDICKYIENVSIDNSIDKSISDIRQIILDNNESSSLLLCLTAVLLYEKEKQQNDIGYELSPVSNEQYKEFKTDNIFANPLDITDKRIKDDFETNLSNTETNSLEIYATTLFISKYYSCII